MNTGNRTARTSIIRRLRIPIALALAFALVLSVSNLYPLGAVEPGAPLNEFTGHLERRIGGLMDDYAIPGVCAALVKEGRVVWSRAFGYADLKAGTEMTLDTYLRVESISKPVTAWGVMKLAEQGKLDLDAPLDRYIGESVFAQAAYTAGDITAGELLSHTAGMPLGNIFERYDPRAQIPTLEESLRAQIALMRAPGESFSYSNVGFNLLELVIESIDGRDFAQYMEEEVLLPLGLRRASFSWSESLTPPVPDGHDLTGKAIPAYVYPEKASGGLLASVEDIAAFAIAGMPRFAHDFSVLSPEGIAALYAPHAHDMGMYSVVFSAYGLGYYVETLPGGEQAVSHGGQGGGWMTHLHAVPETGDAIVILTNSQRSWPFIAYLLGDWAKWSGLSAVGMTRMIWGKYALWAGIGLLWTVMLLRAWRLIEGLAAKTRRFAPLTRDSRPLRALQASAALALIAILVWCVNQDYLFISSVFPIAARYLAISAIALAALLLLCALFPAPHGKTGRSRHA